MVGDHYKVLGLTKNASKAEIKEAFRNLAIKFHPDKHSQSSDSMKQNALHRFKQVSEAYEVLIDDRKRAQYNLRYSASSASSASSTGTYGYGYGYNRNYYSTKYSNSNPRYHNSREKRGSDFEVTLGFLTRRSFLLNLAFASALFGGVMLIQRCGETLWKMQNSGKSFEDIEKIRTQKEKR